MLEDVKNYYGKVLQTSADLQTNACCTGEAMPGHLAELLAQLAPEVVSRYYGCGLVVPPLLDGLRVLDLGCGAGRDVYLLSRLVGEHGSVVGVDMTREQLDVAERYIDEHTRRFGYAAPNVRFVEGELERLDELDLGEQAFDLNAPNLVNNRSAPGHGQHYHDRQCRAGRARRRYPLLVGHLPPVPPRRPGAGLRGLWPGRDLPGHGPRTPGFAGAGQAPCLSAREGDPGLWQHLADAA